MVYKTRMEMSLEGYDREVRPHGAWTAEKISDPSYEYYRTLHDTVGQPYNWQERARIKDKNAIETLLSMQGVEVWQFRDGSDVIGYALLTYAADHTAELEDFGFLPEFCGRGYGAFFITRILQRLKDLGMKNAWLTTRSTNHPKVVSFYEKAGFVVTGVSAI